MAAPRHRSVAVSRKKASARTSRGALLARIAALEERVATLEAEHAGRNHPARPAPAVPRDPDIKKCPGCWLPMPDRPGEKCEFCGFIFGVVSKR
jgi:hypothetical protein